MSYGTFICSPSSKQQHIMKRVIKALVLINQSFCHVLTSEPALLLVRLVLLINIWHQSTSLKSTNNPYLSCWIALTQFECIGETCPPRVHTNCWLCCVCQTHRPLLVFLSLRIYFINTIRPPLLLFAQRALSVCPLPSFSWPVSWCVSTSQSLWDAFLACISRSQREPPAFGGEPCAKPRLVTWSRDRGTVLWSKEH